MKDARLKVALTALFAAGLTFAGGHAAYAHEGHDHDHEHDIAEEKQAPGKIEWVGKHETHTAHGTFKKWKFTQVGIPEGESLEGGELEIEIDITSIHEVNQRRLDHLKNPDFFDVEKFPKATVHIKDVKATEEDGKYTATAKISIRETTSEHPVKFEVTGRDPLHVKGEVELNREAIDVGEPYEEGNPRSIEKTVKVTFDTEVPASVEAGGTEAAM